MVGRYEMVCFDKVAHYFGYNAFNDLADCVLEGDRSVRFCFGVVWFIGLS